MSFTQILCLPGNNFWTLVVVALSSEIRDEYVYVMCFMFIKRPSVKEGRSHSRINESGGHKGVRDQSADEPPLMEEEQHEEMGYQHGYSPSPPHYSSQYRHSSAREYQSDENECPPEEEPEPSAPRNDIRHSKPHKEPVREHNSQDIREQERRKNRPTGVGSSEERSHTADREQQGGTSHKSKHNRHLSPHESKREKKGGSDGKKDLLAIIVVDMTIFLKKSLILTLAVFIWLEIQ